MEWVGKIVARIRGKGKWAGEDIYLIECDDGDKIWRTDSEMAKEVEVKKELIPEMKMEEYEATES